MRTFRCAVVGLSVVVSGSLAVGLSLLTSCASEDPRAAAAPTMEAGFDAELLADGGAADVDVAPPPLGEVCGDKGGLQLDAPWPMRGGCPKRAGYAGGNGPQNATIAWSLPIAAGESSPAIAADHSVWVGTSDGDVLVIAPDGTVRGTFRTGGPLKSSPALSRDGLAVIGGVDGNLYGVAHGALVAADGGDAGGDAADAGDAGSSFGVNRAVFTYHVAPMLSSPAIGGDGTIYVGTSDGTLVAISADGRTTKWTAATNDTLGSSPAIALDGTIYVGSSDHHLYAFGKDGTMKWSYAASAAISGSPAVGGDEGIYVGTTDGKLVALAPDGGLRWTYAAGGAITGTPAVAGGVLYVGSDDRRLHAVSTVTGAGTWTYETHGAVATPIVAKDGTVYVGSADGHIYAVTPGGSLFFAVNAKGKVRGAPALSDDGTLYVTTETSIIAVGP